MPGFARFIVTFSLHDAEFGVGITVMIGSMLVPPSSVIPACIVPGGRLLGNCGVASGSEAALVDEVPGVEVHAPAGVELPTGAVGVIVPVELPPIGVELVVDDVSGVSVAALVPIEGAAIVPSADGVDWVVVIAIVDIGLAVRVVTCAASGEQLTLVPAMVGSSASGTGARVVTGVPGSAAAENGLGPVRGDDTIVPGVDGIPMAVVPMVETCARQPLPPSSNTVIAQNTDRM